MNNFMINSKVKIIFMFVMIFTFLFSFQSQHSFNKCIWVKSDSMVDKKSIEEALLFAYEYNFDTVFLQVRYRGDAFYNSNNVIKNSLIEENFNPLDYAVKLGHSLGLEVHAWVNVYILWSSPYSPKNQSHIYYSNPNWMEVNIHGKSDSSIDINNPQSENWEGIFLSPNHPEVNKYLLSVFTEILNSYDIDGIHFDYIRFQDDIYGFNREGRKFFEEEYDFDPIDIERKIISTKYGWKQTEIDSMQNIWNNYKIKNINNLLVEVQKIVDSLDSNVQISAAVKPDPFLAKKKWSQDWKYWLDKELIDFVVVMNYLPDMIDFNYSIEAIKSNMDKESFSKILMGISIYNQDALNVSDKIYLSYLYNFKGISLFSYDNRKDDLLWYNNIIDIFQIIE